MIKEKNWSQHKKVLFYVNLNNDYIMELIKKAFEKGDFIVEPNHTETEKIYWQSTIACKYLCNRNFHESSSVLRHYFNFVGSGVYTRNIMVFNSSRNGVNQYENLEIFYYCKSYYFSDKKYIFEEFCYTHKKKRRTYLQVWELKHSILKQALHQTWKKAFKNIVEKESEETILEHV